MRSFDDQLLEELCSVVATAAAAVLTVRRGSLDVRMKDDASPVTAADHASEAVLMEGLSRLLPGVAVVSEEAAGASPPTRLPGTFVLVDPLDGTRELIAGRDEFTINLGIVNDGEPQLGIIAAPALGVLWRGIVGSGAERLRLPAGAQARAAHERTPIHTRARPSCGLVAAVSRSHLDARTAALLQKLPITQRLPCGSAVKFGQIAEGTADVYPRLSTTCEWDVAAGHAIVVAAGGRLLSPQGHALRYGQISSGFRIPAFVAWGDPNAPAALV